LPVSKLFTTTMYIHISYFSVSGSLMNLLVNLDDMTILLQSISEL